MKLRHSIVLICCVSVLVTVLLCLKYPEIYYQEYKYEEATELPINEVSVLEELLPEKKVEQTFLSEKDDIRKIDIGIATFARRNNSTLNVELWNVSENKMCEQWVLDAKYIPCFTYQELELQNPIADSKDTEYKIVVYSTDSKQDHVVSLYYDKQGEYDKGSLSVNGEKINGNIKLKVIYGEEKTVIVENSASVIYLLLTNAIFISVLFVFILNFKKLFGMAKAFLEYLCKGLKKNVKKYILVLFCILIISIIPAFAIQLIRSAPGKSMFNPYVYFFVIAFLGALYILVELYKRRLKKLEVYFLVIALIAGGYLTFLQPITTLVSWDDEVHYENVVKLSYFGKYRITKADSYMIQRIMTKNYQIDTVSEDLRELNSLYYGNDNIVEKEAVKYSLPYNKLGYVPAAIVHNLGRMIHLPFSLIFVLGRFANLLVYVIILYYAMKKLKAGKMIVMAIALFPTNLFLACNYSYDYWVNAFTIYGLCYIFGILQKKNYKLTLENSVKILGSLFLGLGPKAVYFPLLLIGLLIGREYFDTKKQQYKWYGASILVMLVVVASFMLSFIVVGPGTGDARGGSDVNSTLQVQFILQNPWQYTKILLNYLFGSYLPIQYSGDYTNLMGYLGKSIFGLFSMALLIWAIIYDNTGEKVMNWKNRCFIAVLLFGTVSLVATALYVAFTPVGYDTVNGCQYRYLLPLILPLSFVISTGCFGIKFQEKTKKNFAIIGMVCLFVIMFGSIFIRLARCYY